jgi:hypothetical protein
MFHEGPGGFSPEIADHADDHSVAAGIIAYLRFDRHVARDLDPTFEPRVFIDEELWYRIKRMFTWLPKERVSHHRPLSDDELGLTLEVARRYGRTRRTLRNSVCDVWGRPSRAACEGALRGAEINLLRIPSYPPLAWLKGARAAGAGWISGQWPELTKLLIGVPPKNRRHQAIPNLRSKLAANWRGAGCPKTVDYRSLKTLLRYCERLGVFKLSRKNRYVWGHVWRNGLLWLDDDRNKR